MESKKINLLHYVFFVYCFFPFTFKSLRLFQIALVYGSSFMYVVFNAKYFIPRIRNRVSFNAVYVFILLLAFILLCSLHTMDLSFLSTFVGFLRSFILILCMSIVLLKHDIVSFEDISRVYINVMVIYISCSIVLLFPPARELWKSIIFTNERAEKLIKSIAYYTRFGLQGFSGWSHTVYCAIGVSLFWVLKLNKSQISYTKFFILLLGCAFYGRSGLIVALMNSVVACVCAIKFRKIKYILLLAFIGIILFSALLMYMEYFTSEYKAVSWILEPFVNKLQGKSSSSSSNELKEMYQRLHFDSVNNLLFGYGYYGDEKVGYYQNVDMGWARPLLFGGLFFEIVYYLSLLLVFFVAINCCPLKIRSIFMLLIISQFLTFEMKGETYLMFTRALLLFCFAKQGNINAISVYNQSVYDRWCGKSFLKYCFKYQ